MKITFDSGVATIVREPGDPPARNESHFWYLVRQELNGKQTYGRGTPGRFAQPWQSIYQTGRERWIKKEMVKDGHLVSQGEYYVRERKPTNGKFECLHDHLYATRNAAKDYNAGEVEVMHEVL